MGVDMDPYVNKSKILLKRIFELSRLRNTWVLLYTCIWDMNGISSN